ncbi:hypothetical protein CH251_00160 [Rhodococcus sp. 06-462-5]|uniref:hypothetical protein n=1 Tax=unclassified Rhodococcus (in: high G+C Gram-positive bacteria) TaxID=192944 RepID=UPI000B9BD411|nr:MULTISPECIES: hypothetical protein [unclassified Rhodococcus (in: high G+C Gram-positive bacteria)]OZC79363.1 hypothetical protein CH251_00160 [Rhodococcus sp. 06-462-5]OZE59920.1 hypothetical protein CH270_22100 [Rhodococcus sp. 02-925g]
MTDAQPNLIAHWQDLNAQADAGTITIPSDVAAKCDAACVTYLAHLQKMQAQATQLGEFQDWGDLKSAQDLRDRFLRKATGTDRSLDVILQQHIDVIESMRMLFRRYFDETEATDTQTAANVTALTPGG